MNWDRLISRFLTICPPLVFAAYLIKWGYGLFTAGPDAGGDFLQYWVASSLAAAGEAASVYNFHLFGAKLESMVGHEFPLAFFYPPSFLLSLVPLSYLPYFLALITWLSLPLVGLLQVVRRIAPHRLTMGLALAFPGTLLNIGYGQNGFLSAALLGGGLFLLESFPYTAGVLFALLSYKPHLAALVPVALIAGRHWRALGAAIVTFGFMALLSGLVLGWATWEAFWRQIPLAFNLLEIGAADWRKMTAVFPAALLAGCSLWVAFILQELVMLGALAMVAWAWFRKASFPIRASVLVLSALLFTPHAYEYDLVLLVLPLTWLGWEGFTKGWLPGEPAALAVGWLTPLFCGLLTKALYFQITPVTLAILLFLVLRRHRQSYPHGSEPMG